MLACWSLFTQHMYFCVQFCLRFISQTFAKLQVRCNICIYSPNLLSSLSSFIWIVILNILLSIATCNVKKGSNNSHCTTLQKKRMHDRVTEIWGSEEMLPVCHGRSVVMAHSAYSKCPPDIIAVAYVCCKSHPITVVSLTKMPKTQNITWVKLDSKDHASCFTCYCQKSVNLSIQLIVSFKWEIIFSIPHTVVIIPLSYSYLYD